MQSWHIVVNGEYGPFTVKKRLNQILVIRHMTCMCCSTTELKKLDSFK